MLPNRKRRPYFMYVVLAFSSTALRNKKMLAYLLCWTTATCWQNGRQADQHQEPHKHMPKLFGPLRERYQSRPGGYTRVLRIEPLKTDQAPSAILELVDGPKDIRFLMTAKTLARQRSEGIQLNDFTRINIKKVTQFREDGEEALKQMVNKLRSLEVKEDKE